MPAAYHFDCICYYVSEMERAISFYRDVLGFKFVSRDIVARFDIDGILFELVPATSRDKLQGSGNARLCLQVDDIEQALRELHARGVPATTAENKGAGILASLRDPDGNEICLWQYLSEPSPAVTSS
jgi:catechol 2,3-dioxygenase-like lactoylglutathione lyase family enzyme